LELYYSSAILRHFNCRLLLLGYILKLTLCLSRDIFLVIFTCVWGSLNLDFLILFYSMLWNQRHFQSSFPLCGEYPHPPSPTMYRGE